MLRGLKENTSSCVLLTTQVEMSSWEGRVQSSSVELESSSTPKIIHYLLSEFEEVFEEPQGLLPTQEFDHAIPLILGAQPVNLHPYRYHPAQKG